MTVSGSTQTDQLTIAFFPILCIANHFNLIQQRRELGHSLSNLNCKPLGQH